jgi:metal-responsive CopG/Arc/MetJ family transcriptional regulator
MDAKIAKTRKNITMNEDINKKLEELSSNTGYSQSEIIETALKNLDGSFRDKNYPSLKNISITLGCNEKVLIGIVIDSILKKAMEE